MLGGIIEALGFGSAREARLLVARLPVETALTVATADDKLTRALARGPHKSTPLAADRSADAALALGLPDGDEGLALVERLVRSTREGGIVHVATAMNLAGDRGRRARVAGLFLRAGLVDLAQEQEGGVIYTLGRVNRVGGA